MPDVISKGMRVYHLNKEQKKLLEVFARDVSDETLCKLSDDMESPLDPYDQHGNFDEAKAKAMLQFIAEEIKSYL
jgi:hypothetical protein